MSPKEYKKLQRQWDAKLKRSGFDDIEVTPDGRREDYSPYTKRHPAHLIRQVDRGIPQRSAEWYRLAQQWLHERGWPWEPRWNEGAWEMLAYGETQAAVLRQLKPKYTTISKAILAEWFRAENSLMTETLCDSSHAHTASYGELVHLRGVLEETAGDYRWEVRLEDGQTIEIDEDYLRYRKG